MSGPTCSEFVDRGASTNVAIESAGVVLAGKGTHAVLSVIELSRANYH